MTPNRTSGKLHAGWLNSFDPRVKVFVALVIGLSAWRCGPLGLGLLGVALAGCLLSLRGSWLEIKRMLGVYLVFLVTWAAIKTGLGVLIGQPLAEAIGEAAWLGLRLAVVLALGLVLALSTSTRSLGLALAWAMKPFLRSRAWKAALALALMVHFVPLVGRVTAACRQTAMRRVIRNGWRLLLIPQATLRVLSQKTWQQTVAVAVRRLDHAEAWDSNLKVRPLEVAASVVLAAAVVGLSVVS